MDDFACRQFFLEPSCPQQRQYDALRAVFIAGLSQKQAAARHGYSYDAFRQLVHQFRRDLSDGHPPPFSANRIRVARRPTAIPTPRHRNSPLPR